MSDSISRLSFRSRSRSPEFDPSSLQCVVAKVWELKSSIAVDTEFALPFSAVANESLGSTSAITLSCPLDIQSEKYTLRVEKSIVQPKSLVVDPFGVDFGVQNDQCVVRILSRARTF